MRDVAKTSFCSASYYESEGNKHFFVSAAHCFEGRIKQFESNNFFITFDPVSGNYLPIQGVSIHKNFLTFEKMYSNGLAEVQARAELGAGLETAISKLNAARAAAAPPAEVSRLESAVQQAKLDLQNSQVAVISKHYLEPNQIVNDVAVLMATGILPENVSTLRIVPQDLVIELPQTFTLAGYGMRGKSVSAIQDLWYIDLPLTAIHDVQKELVFLAKDGHDVCYGDSGGPAVLTRNTAHYLAAVLSRKSSPYSTCGDSGGVYTDVRFFREWITCQIASLKGLRSSPECKDHTANAITARRI